MKKPFVILASCVMLLVASCSYDDSFDGIDESTMDNVLTDDPYNYSYTPKVTDRSELSIRKPGENYYPPREEWIDTDTYFDRVEKLNLSQSTLKSLNTLELIDVCMSHPFTGNLLAFNSYEQGVNSLIRDFNGLRELKNRKDAFEKLLYYYDRKLDRLKQVGEKEGYIDCVFMMRYCEYFMITGYLYPIKQLSKNVTFQNIVLKAGEIKKRCPSLATGHYAGSQYDMEWIAGFHPGEDINPLLLTPVTLKTLFE